MTAVALHPALRAPPARWPLRLGHWLAVVATSAMRSLRMRPRKASVEAHWHAHSRRGGAAGSTIDDLTAVAPDRGRDATADRAGAIDRICAMATMIVAAGLAAVVSVFVAPQLRNANMPVPEATALAAQGRQTYLTACAACHGAELKGSAAQATGGPPPLDASGHAWLHSDATLFRMVKYGIANCRGDPTQAEMPGLGDRLDDRSIHAVLAFVKSQWPADQRTVQDAFNDGESDAADNQTGALCTPICVSAAAKTASSARSNLIAR